jgi:hypothetical protein
MRKKFSFGKVDGYHRGRKTCEVTLEVELKDTDKGPEFTASGNMWNNLHTDIIRGGQCIDDMAEEFPFLKKNKLYAEIMDLWSKYHLNGMNAGTPEQTEAIKNWEAQGNRYDYDKVCEYLKSINLYEVPIDKTLYPDLWGRESEKQGTDTPMYKYGHAWLYRAIPDDDMARIKALFEGE